MAAVLKSARELAAAGKDLGRLSQDLLGFFRNLVIYQVSPTALEDDLSGAEKTVLAELAPQISRSSALGILDELSHLENRLRARCRSGPRAGRGRCRRRAEGFARTRERGQGFG